VRLRASVKIRCFAEKDGAVYFLARFTNTCELEMGFFMINGGDFDWKRHLL
jgi:hypothetical protein